MIGGAPIDWTSEAGELRPTLREWLLMVRKEVERLQCSTWGIAPHHGCDRCRALERIDQELRHVA